jgi:DNA-directed RNA polymerase specialized sigma subunit
MSRRDDDTELDALAAQARSHPPLSAVAADRLIGAARGGDRLARESLVEHSLGAVLAEAVAHRDHGVEVTDLYQEGSLAMVVAIEEYTKRGGSGAGMAGYVRRVVAAHLDGLVAEAEAAAVEAAALLEDTRLLEIAQVALRGQIGHEPSSTELAAVLLWPRERVELIAGMVASAREAFDAEIVEFLDDDDAVDADGEG